MSSQFKQLEDHGQLWQDFSIGFVAHEDVDYVQKRVMESKWHLWACLSAGALCTFELVDDHLDRLEFFLCMRPEDKRLFKQVKRPLHNLLVILIVAVVQRHLDKEIQTDLRSPVSIRVLIDLINRLLLLIKRPLFLQLQLRLLELPLNVNKRHVTGNLLDKRVGGGGVVSDHQPLHGVDHLGFELVLLELVEDGVVLDDDLPESD